MPLLAGVLAGFSERRAFRSVTSDLITGPLAAVGTTVHDGNRTFEFFVSGVTYSGGTTITSRTPRRSSGGVRQPRVQRTMIDSIVVSPAKDGVLIEVVLFRPTTTGILTLVTTGLQFRSRNRDDRAER